MTRSTHSLRHLLASAAVVGLSVQSSIASAAPLNLSDTPLFVSEAVPPLALLVMGRDHKLYYEAYNDASDLNGDGIIDVGYKPEEIDYFGYFDSYKCYQYNNEKFQPKEFTDDKRCGSDYWSGDFLNYLTMSRMDALRKVLYGGYRSTDTAASTILERSHIPQDAHSWGKEYQSIEVDGYDIRDYSPLGLPAPFTRHLFANTTIDGYDKPPLLRVLNDSTYRIWEWVSIERPVAGERCEHGSTGPSCEQPASYGSYDIAPPEFFDSLTRSFYRLYGDSSGDDVPDNEDEFQALIENLGEPLETGAASNIDDDEAPAGRSEEFVTIFRGEFTLDRTRTLDFGIDGDDAVELLVDDKVVVGWYGTHPAAGNGSTHTGNVSLTEGSHEIEFRHVENGGDQSYRLYLQDSRPASEMTDYIVRLEVCVPGLLEDNCQRYVSDNDGDGDTEDDEGGSGTGYKPVGLLHEFGADNRMLFGLLTGSYRKNQSGGVLRRNVGSFGTELNPKTGVFNSDYEGLVTTIDRLRTVRFRYSDYLYECGSPSGGQPKGEGICQMWGNPIGEMMYEGLRYFAGKGSATPAYAIDDANATLNLPVAEWQNPYAASSAAMDAGANYCSKPFQLVISDINPSYDSDQVPGSHFSDGTVGGDISGLDVSDGLAVISEAESGIPGTYFIGEAGGEYTGSPTAKYVENLATTRGLSPEEPTKRGSYTAAAIARYGNLNEITNSPAEPDSSQNMQTFAVALASPLPRIEIPAGEGKVTLVPFAKSVGGAFGIEANKGEFQPTNQIVDFYVDTIRNVDGFPVDEQINGGRPYYKFRINFEDVEQGNDHDMDAIVLYEVRLNADNSITVDLDSTYAAGGVIHHLGYVISGTTQDGTYLEVRDRDTNGGNDPDYYLDTPSGVVPGQDGDGWNDDVPLPLAATRTFTPADTSGAGFLNGPLWYAAKWGGFQDRDGDDEPDGKEWDADSDGDPDNYFLVTNAGNLKAQLTTAFEQILARTGTAGSVSFSTGSLQTGSRLYQANLNSENWTGEVNAYNLNSEDVIGTDGEIEQFAGSVASLAWSAASLLDSLSWDVERRIVTWRPDGGGDIQAGTGRPFRWPDGLPEGDLDDLETIRDALSDTSYLSAQQVMALSRIPGTDAYDDRGDDRLEYIRGRAVSDFRERTSLLGDIVHSSPLFVGRSMFPYPDDLGDGEYSAFQQQVADRDGMVYVGANDGMLHAFDAETGQEVYAFVPSAVYRDLTELTAEDYTHRYFVDGTPLHVDVYFDDADKWRSVLVGGLRKGGQGIYALDITEPPAGDATETNIAENVLWEFTDAQSAQLGYTYAQPTAGVLASGEWFVIAGNGYNNTVPDGAVGDGTAGLFLINIESGQHYFIDTGDSGESSNANAGQPDPDTGRPNGLSTAAPVDMNGDYVVDFVYGGDLRGNLWRFDVRSDNYSQWDATLVFTARNDEGQTQPITVQPTVGRHPAGKPGVVVYFGTGKFLETTDKNTDNQPTQTIYAIWDDYTDNVGVISRAEGDLLEQTITADIEYSSDEIASRELRVTSANEINWDEHRGWYLDLFAENKMGTDDGNEGERLVNDIILRSGRVIFNTLVPSENPCEFGGDGWLMALDAESGAREDRPTFDLNNDGSFDTADLPADIEGTGDGSIGGIRVGTIGAVNLITDTQNNRDIAVVNDTDGTLGEPGEEGGGNGFPSLNPAIDEIGRQSWREIL